MELKRIIGCAWYIDFSGYSNWMKSSYASFACFLKWEVHIGLCVNFVVTNRLPWFCRPAFFQRSWLLNLNLTGYLLYLFKNSFHVRHYVVWEIILLSFASSFTLNVFLFHRVLLWHISHHSWHDVFLPDVGSGGVYQCSNWSY